MYSYKIFNSFKDCENYWKFDDNEYSLSFFQELLFLKELIKIGNTKIRIVFIFKKEKIIAILPLEIKRIYFLSTLQWLGSDFSDFCNPIFIKSEKFKIDQNYFLNVWQQILNNIGNFDLIFLNKQLSNIENNENPFVKFFNTSKYSQIYNVLITKTFSDYKNAIKDKDKRHYYELHRTLLKFEKLKENEEVFFKVDSSKEGILSLKDHILQKKGQLEKKGVKNNFTKNFLKVFDNLTKEKKINFYLMSLKVNQETIAQCLGFVFKNTFYYYIPLLASNKYNRFKPGKILITEIIRWCIDNDIKKFDFGLGAEKYKKYFSNKKIDLHRYLEHRNLKGLIAYTLISFYLKLKLVF